MEKVKNWLKEKKNRFFKSKFFVFVIALIIGATYTYVYQVGLPYYQQMKEGYNTATNFLQIRAYRDSLVPTGEHQAEKKESVSQGTESEETPSSPSILSIVDRIYQLESSSGKNDQKCERIGRHNGYGYGQWEGHNTCFSSDDEAREQVIKWFEKKLKTMSYKEALRLYSGNSAGYVEKFNDLIWES